MDGIDYLLQQNLKHAKDFDMTDSRTSTDKLHKTSLQQLGDRELYYAQGKDESWRLPMYIDWKIDIEKKDHYALVQPAITPYQSQRLVMNALFSPYDLLGESDRWIIPRKICETILYKAPGISRNYYYLWPEDDCPPLPPPVSVMKFGLNSSQPASPGSGHPFIKHVATMSDIPSSVVSIVFKAICKEAPAWMLENKKPLDLGFCQLVAFPFRVNWKQIIAEKCKSWKLGKLFTEAKDDGDLNEKLAALRMPSVMCSPQNIALNRGKIDYTLEAIPTGRFTDAVKKVESQRMACGWNAYVAHYEESVETLYSYMVRALGIYIKKVSSPFAKVSESGVTSVIRLLPVGGKHARVHGVVVDDIPVHIIPPDSSFSITAEESDPKTICYPVDEMQDMPAVLQAPDDMRECDEQGDVDEQGHSGTVRLSLRHDEKGESEGKPMLPGSKNSFGTSWMEPK